ncbi:hypothetical protein SDC9_210273 [bioreactor metagenome]|uniref:Protein CotJB domain-containing protein n=1 Tax=bioreactor metagenome TaxID=1076179 RepID=A0A645JQK8_9ZZZZ|nr:spore coat protein CotJB [Lachnospiraceae bacterium]
MDRDLLLSRLTALDFMAVDIALFLNTHPEKMEAIKFYNRIIMMADTLREEYEKSYGPLCSFRSYAQNENKWDWINNPWPWQKDFNFDMSVEGCNVNVDL